MAVDEPADFNSDPVDDPVAELRLVERELAEAQREVDELRQEIGDPAEEPGDRAARAALITSLEQQKALVERFEARAAELRRRLGQA